jgi:acid phosphatase (class B)
MSLLKRPYFYLTLLASLWCTAPAFSASEPETVQGAGATLQQLNSQYAIHWISVEQIAAELKDKPPTDVGFDLDDTLFYSTPAFFHGQQMFSPGNNDFLKNKAFWEQVSNGWDAFSVPKKSAQALIKLHRDRGDRIWFITGRPMPGSGHEALTPQIAKDFAIPTDEMNPVIFSGEGKGAKVNDIRSHHIRFYYGDADNDITDARAAGAEGIRVLRPLNSSNLPLPRNGVYGERVVINSDY